VRYTSLTVHKFSFAPPPSFSRAARIRIGFCAEISLFSNPPLPREPSRLLNVSPRFFPSLLSCRLGPTFLESVLPPSGRPESQCKAPYRSQLISFLVFSPQRRIFFCSPPLPSPTPNGFNHSLNPESTASSSFSLLHKTPGRLALVLFSRLSFLSLVSCRFCKSTPLVKGTVQEIVCSPPLPVPLLRIKLGLGIG